MEIFFWNLLRSFILGQRIQKKIKKNWKIFFIYTFFRLEKGANARALSRSGKNFFFKFWFFSWFSVLKRKLTSQFAKKIFIFKLPTIFWTSHARNDLEGAKVNRFWFRFFIWTHKNKLYQKDFDDFCVQIKFDPLFPPWS